MTESLSNRVAQFESDIEIAHQIVHGTAEESVDTEGGQVRTFAKIQADYDAQIVQSETHQNRVAAEAAAGAAIVARDEAQLAAGIFPTIAAGLAATVGDEYFSVPSAESDEYLILYLNSGGVAIEQKRYPAVARITALEARTDAAESDIGALESRAVDVEIVASAGLGRQRNFRALLSGYDDSSVEVEIDAGQLLVGGPDVIARLADEAILQRSAFGAAWSARSSARALLSGYDDSSVEVEIDAGQSLVGGPDVIARLADEAARGVVAYKLAAKRTLLADYDDAGGEQQIDADGAVVGGPIVIASLDQRLASVEASVSDSSVLLSAASRSPVYIDAGALKAIDASGPQIMADISPHQFIRSAQWRGPAVISAIDRPSLGSETPVAVSVTDDGYISVIPSAQKLLIVIPSYGQSNSVGAQAYDPPAVMTESDWPENLLMFDLAAGVPDVRMGLPSGSDTITVLNGANLIGFRPLISVRSAAQTDRGATVLEGIGFTVQKIASQYFGLNPKVLMFAAGWGGQNYSKIKKGTTVYSNLITALTVAKALADEQGLIMYVPFVPFVHGEGDTGNTNYVNDVQTLQADIEEDVKAITGQQGSIPLVCSQASAFTADNTNGVQGIYEACKSSNLHILSGVYYPYQFYTDNLHLGNRGIYLGEKMARSALRSAKLWGLTGKSTLKPSQINFDGSNTITITLDVPVGPIVQDTADPIVNSPAPANWGFDVKDGSGNDVAISSISIVENSIVIVTETTPAAGSLRVVRYAMSGYQSETWVAGQQPRGQVRDSEITPSIVDGKPLYNWLCHFSESF